MKNISHSVAGIDVSGRVLDMAYPIKGGHFASSSFANEDDAIKKQIGALIRRGVKTVVLEATGGLELRVWRALEEAGIAVAQVNPRQIRDFAKGAGELAKTDKIDAGIIAQYGVVMQPRIIKLPSENMMEIKSLAARRRQLVEVVKAEKNRLTRTHSSYAAQDIEDHILELKKRIASLQKEIERRIEVDRSLADKSDLLASMTGIGKVTALTLISELPELGTIGRGQIAKLAGLAPLNNDSGTRRGVRYIWGGRAVVRQPLYMAATAARQHCPSFKRYFERLIEKGKPYKVALIALMRKMLTILNAMVKTNTKFKAASTRLLRVSARRVASVLSVKRVFRPSIDFPSKLCLRE
jgi:transposase